METQTFTRRQLYDLVWKEPIDTLAARFGLSDRGLAKLCDRHGIPTPPRGYWAKKQAGRRVLRTPMLEFADSKVSNNGIVARLALPKAQATAEDADPLLGFWQAQRDEIGAIQVAKTLANPHPVVAAWIGRR